MLIESSTVYDKSLTLISRMHAGSRGFGESGCQGLPHRSVFVADEVRTRHHRPRDILDLASLTRPIQYNGTPLLPCPPCQFCTDAFCSAKSHQRHHLLHHLQPHRLPHHFISSHRHHAHPGLSSSLIDLPIRRESCMSVTTLW